jgi:hypothetical protein
MFSLCIPTIDRFDTFLSKYLDSYINNEYISEIIITDENGNDIEKIKNKYGKNEKLILMKNPIKFGPFLNKIQACKLAKNDWIALIDSDNFADTNYFICAKNYIENFIGDKKNVILAPSKAKPNFDYSHLSGFIFKNGSFRENKIKESQFIKSHNAGSVVLMNTGNYVLHKYLIDNINLTNETHNISLSSSCDVIYYNTLLFEQLDLNLYVVPNMEYEHVVHGESIYIQTHQQFANFANIVHNRYNSLN